MMTLCIGWDVGGWHGRKDGLAGLKLSREGVVSWVGRTVTIGLGDVIAGGNLTLRHFAEPIELEEALADADRIVLGIDAPFGFPAFFADSAGGEPDASPPMEHGLPDRYIDNTLAYRYTDRMVHERTGKRPLSPSLGPLSNNATKTRCALTQVCRFDDVRVPPFHADQGRAAAVEVYPALWQERFELKTTLRRVGIGSQVELFRSLPDDEQDAVLAALSAAAYESTRRDLDGLLPEVAMPPDDEAVRREGWIYAP